MTTRLVNLPGYKFAVAECRRTGLPYPPVVVDSDDENYDPSLAP